MLALAYQGQVTTGDDAYDVGISDLMVMQGPNGPILVSVTSMDGGFVSYSLAEDSSPTLETIRAFEADLHAANGPSLVEFGDGVLATGLGAGEVVNWDISNNHSLINRDIDDVGSDEWTHVAAISDTRIVVAAEDSDEMSVYDLNSNGEWELVKDRSDRSDTFLSDLGALEAVSVGGKDFVVTASTSETGVSVYEVTNTNILGRDHIDASDGVGMMIPTDIEIAQVGGNTYVLVANAPSSGSSGAITVMELSSTGTLTPTDHILDTRDSRFGSVQDLSVQDHNGITIVVAGGGDDGVSLLALLENGTLVHLGAVANSLDGGLDGVTNIETAIMGDTLHVYVASGGDHGITTLTADLSGIGTGKVADDNGGVLSGTNKDDILMDGAGSDTLLGGNGGDIFVLGSDGMTDQITGFDVNKDTIDLSSLVQLYDAGALTITSTSNGARIEWRGEILILTSSNGHPINEDALRDAITLDIDRSFYAPELSLVGTNGDDTLDGSWGIDTIAGSGGDDTLFGGGGDDTLSGGSGDNVINGGAGDDTAILTYHSDDLILVETAGNTLTVTSTHGTDVFIDIETFAFTDTTLLAPALTGIFQPASLMGTAGDDVLTATTKTAQIDGDSGDDRLISGAFDDTLWGGAGDDTLSAGAGDDSIMGGSGVDCVVLDYASTDLLDISMSASTVTLTGPNGTDILSSVEEFDFTDGMILREDLFDLIPTQSRSGDAGNDTLTLTDATAVLTGGAGDDTLTSGEGDDTLYGGDGDDALFAGAGDDHLFAGTGDHTINGGSGQDILTLTYASSDLIDVETNGTTITLTTAAEFDAVTGVETFHLSDGTFTTNELSAMFETITMDGTSGSDILTAGSTATALRGYDGDDVLSGGSSNDTLIGDDGNDLLRGFQGDDIIDAGAGNDNVWSQSGDDTLYGGDGDDWLRGGPDEDVLFGGDGNDALRGQRHNDSLAGGNGNDNLVGGGGNDTVDGNGGDDFLKGGTYHDHLDGGWGNDTLYGNRGDDTLAGQRGEDVIRGGGNDDTIVGGEGDDLLFGGKDADLFVFTSGHDADIIGDFNVDEDTLRLSDALTQGVTDAGEVVEAYVTLTAQGAVFDFGSGDTILLEGVTTLDGLDDALDIA